MKAALPRLVPRCCYIYILPVIGQRLKIRCPREARWQINSAASKDNYHYTESCDKHVGQLLDDSGVHHIWRVSRETER